MIQSAIAKPLNGTVDQPFDHQGPRWQIVGIAKSGPRRGFSIHRTEGLSACNGPESRDDNAQSDRRCKTDRLSPEERPGRTVSPQRAQPLRGSHVSIRCRSAAGYERSSSENKSDGTFLFLGE